MQKPVALLQDRLGDIRPLIDADAAELSLRLQAQQLRDFPPSAQKTMRRFSSAEASRFIGIHEGYLRQLVAERKTPLGEGSARRTYSIEEIEDLRAELQKTGKGSLSTLRYVGIAFWR
ncbi:MAG: hypothetical protein MUE84_19245 [Hyphomonas sp.]|nr:hypothetical protein [Hyphomonas sp.]